MQTASPFTNLRLSEPIITALNSMGYRHTTPVQEQALPWVLQGKDVLVQAPTGTGKTVAFGVGMLNALLERINIRDLASKAEAHGLILCPTRELADQVAKVLRQLARCVPNFRVVQLVGGTPIASQHARLQAGAHVIVGTPGRLLDHLQFRPELLSQVRMFVLDEADRMLDMGFEEALVEIDHALPRRRHTLLFSATFPAEIRSLSAQYQKDAQLLTIAHHLPAGLEQGYQTREEPILDLTETGEHALTEPDANPSQIEQLFVEVEPKSRIKVVADILVHESPESALVFCATKSGCNAVAQQLEEEGFGALVLHGDLDQRLRSEVLSRFSNKSCSVLVATDVAARGIDFPSLDVVVNFDLSRDAETHTHRIGRTGRAGKSGKVWNLHSQKQTCLVNAMRKHKNALVRTLPKVVYTGPASLFSANCETDLPHGELRKPIKRPRMMTLRLAGGRKTKLRRGDILGALTGDAGLAADQVGQIDIFDFHSFVAVARADCESKWTGTASSIRVKGRSLNVSLAEGGLKDLLKAAEVTMREKKARFSQFSS